MTTITRVLAPNPGPMTLTGTNTWVITTPAGTVVVDPGPDVDAHLAAVRDRVERPLAIVLTHRHADHSAGAPSLADHLRCPVLAVDPGLVRGAAPLHDGDRIGELAVITTPGHTDDSICLVHARERVIFTGDTVLGGSSTVISHPEGTVADHLRSLERLTRIAAAQGIERLLPGHGEPEADPSAALTERRRHREDRLAQVRSVLASGATTVDAVTAVVHPGLAEALVPAARRSIAAQLHFLGVVDADDTPG